MSLALQMRMSDVTRQLETALARLITLQVRVEVLEKQVVELRERVRNRISEIAEDRVRPRLMAKTA
jgi:chaperonin cofactor prefoldin